MHNSETESRIGWRLERSYAGLPDLFFSNVAPAAVPSAKVVLLNRALGASLGLDLDAIDEEVAAELFAGQRLPGEAMCIAQAYAGHQFGGFTMLGDGRAIVLGEQRTPDGRLVDIQFKGSGQTPYSRRGDGLAALGPMLREYVISEAMAALGIPTTRSLAVVATGAPVYRERPRRGAILTRVAASHLRVGTFQYAAGQGDPAALRALAEYAIARHDPDLIGEENRVVRFLERVMERQIELVARWQMVGFVHGVLNTDNVAISGETIDYGPCAFMDAYDPATVFSSIDEGGRYAFGNQPSITLWNLCRFAEAMLPLIDEDPDRAVAIATELLETFPARFEARWMAGMRAKLGLRTLQEEDAKLVHDLLDLMKRMQADFTRTFRMLSEAPSAPPIENSNEADGAMADELRRWHTRWLGRLRSEERNPAEAGESMRAVNPAVIPRNHLVEAALEVAEEADDLAPTRQLLEVLRRPFDAIDAERAPFAASPPPSFCGHRTFCGT